MAKIDRKPRGCWLWTGAIDTMGYGVINSGGRGRKLYAHRVSHELLKGPIPDGHDILHACDVRACVNPNHLSTGTRKDNVQDALRKGRLRGRFSGMATCLRRHPFDAENTYIKSNGYRACRTCARDRMRLRRNH